MTPTRSTSPPIRSFPLHRSGPGWQPPHLRLTLEWMDPGCVLSVAGTLDRDSAVALDAEFEQLERSGCDDVVIDVSGLVQIDESGGVALAELWARMRTCGISCRIRGLHPVFGESPLELLLFLRNGVPLRREPGAGTRPWQMSRLVPRIS